MPTRCFAFGAVGAADGAGSRSESTGQDDKGGELHCKGLVGNEGEGWEGVWSLGGVGGEGSEGKKNEVLLKNLRVGLCYLYSFAAYAIQR